MDKIEELKKLKQLLDDGVISENEFQSLKNEILNNGTETSRIVQDYKKLKLDEEVNNEDSYGTLTVSYEGRWFLIDAKTTLNINGVMHSKHSTKKGFSVDIPIESNSITIKVIVGGVSSTTYDLKELKKGCNYSLELIFDDTWGKYSNKFKLSEKVNAFQGKKDKDGLRKEKLEDEKTIIKEVKEKKDLLNPQKQTTGHIPMMDVNLLNSTIKRKAKNRKARKYLALFAVVVFGFFIIKASFFDSSDKASFNNIDISNLDDCLSSVQGKWSITLNSNKKGQHINIRLLIDGKNAKLFSKNDNDNDWNMNYPNETFRIEIIALMSECQYCPEYRRVDFNDIKEKNDILGEVSLAYKLSGMKISKTGVEMISMMYKSGFHRGWE